MDKSIAEIMSEPATVEEIIRKANEINDRLREVENMPEPEEEEPEEEYEPDHCICGHCDGTGCSACGYAGVIDNYEEDDSFSYRDEI